MSSINTNVPSLIAQNVLAQNNASLNTSLERLSTGLQINSGADNPSGLIAVQDFNQENTGLTTAINNASIAGNVAGTAEGGLSEVSNLLTQLQGLVGQAANTGGLSSNQVQADQLQVNSILDTINRIAGGTNFQGTHLLNGNLAYTTSGLHASAVQNLSLNSVVVPSGSQLKVNVTVVASGKQAEITTVQTKASAATTLTITGNLGSAQIAVGSGQAGSAIAAAINAVKSDTGVTASATISGTVSKELTLSSSDFGSAQFVSVSASTNAGFNSFDKTTATGTDATVDVNGNQASVAGLHVTVATGQLDLSFDLASQLNSPTSSESFYVTGGGANFALGSQVNEAGLATIGIGNVSTTSLGDFTNGYLNTLGTGGANDLASSNLDTAQNIVNSAIQQVATLRGQIGSFQDYTIGSTVSALNVAYENSSAAESAIQDTNFASETSNLTRAQILTQSASTVLAQANAAPQEALTLLRNS